MRSGWVRSHSDAEDHVQELFVGDGDDAVPVVVVLAEQLRQVLGRQTNNAVTRILHLHP